MRKIDRAHFSAHYDKLAPWWGLTSQLKLGRDRQQGDDMEPLTWACDWANDRATATAHHGTYTIARLLTGEWAASFTRAETEKYRRTKHTVGKRSETYASAADAMRACHRHAEHYTPESSDRLYLVTPRPS